MPAHRSADEGEIREAVVARLREQRPTARIIHEVNVSSFGPNRIEVLAIDTAEIIAVEIKSKRDKLDRLAAQILAMRGVAHHVVAAIHEKFLVETTTHEKAQHYQRDGVFYLRTWPDGWSHSVEGWVFPERHRCIYPEWRPNDSMARWRMRPQRLDAPLPAAALDLLWRDELAWLCGSLRVAVGRRATMPDMVDALRWHCTGKELTRGICAALRTRICVEADEPIPTSIKDRAA